MLLMGLEVEFTAEGLADLLAGIQSVGAESAAAAPEVDMLKGAVGELKSVVLELVGAVSLVEIGKKMFDEVSQTQLATNQLGIAFRNVGADATAFGANIAAAIAPLRGQGQYTEWEINQALARLITLTGDAGGAMANIGLVANIAAFRHTDLASAALLVSRAMEGNFTMLQRYIPSLRDFNTQAEKMAELQRVMAGQAEAAADTIGGSLKKEGTALAELGEGLGAEIARSSEWQGMTDSIVTSLHSLTAEVTVQSGAIHLAVNAVMDLVHAFRDLFAVLAPGISVFRQIVYEIGTIVEGFAEWGQVLKAAAGGWEEVFGVLMQTLGHLTSDHSMEDYGKRTVAAAQVMASQVKASIADIEAHLTAMKDELEHPAIASVPGDNDANAPKNKVPDPALKDRFAEELKALEARQKLVAEGLAQAESQQATVPKAIALEKELTAAIAAQSGNLDHQIQLRQVLAQLRTAEGEGVGKLKPPDAQKFDTQIDPTAQAVEQATKLHALALEQQKDSLTAAQGATNLAIAERELYAIRASGLASGTQMAEISKTLAQDDGAAARAKSDYLAGVKADVALATEEIKTKSALAAHDKQLALAELELAKARTDVTQVQRDEIQKSIDELTATGLPKFHMAGVSLGQALQAGFQEAFAKGGTGGKALETFGSQILKSLGNIFAQMGADLLTFGLLMSSLYTALSANPLAGGIVAIAVAAGLEALSQAMSADVKGTSGGGAFSLPASQGSQTSTSYLTPSSSQPYAQGTTYPGQGAPPMQFTIIGPADPRAQTAIMEAVTRAVARGKTVPGIGGN